VSATAGQLQLIARRLALDFAAGEAVTALRAAGVRPILLKGASVAHWLYEGREWEPGYGDVDLLVAPECRASARQVLTALEYVNRSFPDRSHTPFVHAYHWERTGSRPADIDLHRRLFLVGADDAVAWAILVQHTETIELGRVEMEVLSAAARAMLVALHAAWHGVQLPGPMRDLDRATEVLDLGTSPNWTRESLIDAVISRLHRGTDFGWSRLSQHFPAGPSNQLVGRGRPATEEGAAVANRVCALRPCTPDLPRFTER
jgi:hypothetical protein